MASVTYDTGADGYRVVLGNVGDFPNAVIFRDNSASVVVFGGLSGDSFAWDIDTTREMTLSATGFTMNGVDLFVADGQGIIVGHTAQLTVSDGGGATGIVPEAQVIGTSQADATLLLAAFSTTATRAAAATLAFVKGGAATVAVGTVVTNDEILGSIIAYGDDGTDLLSAAAAIEFAVDAAPGTGDMAGRIVFYTSIDAGEVLTERMRIDNEGVMRLTNATTAPSGAGSGTNQVGLFSEDVSSATVLGIECETAVAAETDETKFSDKIQVRINGTSYFIMLTVS